MRLREITWHELAMYGDLRRDRREGDPDNPYWKNTLSLSSLPSLSVLNFGGDNLVNFGHVRLECIGIGLVLIRSCS